MREVDVKLVEQAVRDLCISANKILPADLENRISACAACETAELPCSIMQSLQENILAAKELDIPVCQDTGMAVVFAEIGQDVHFIGGGFEDAVNRGVSRGYTEGYLRCSVVADPLRRVNTGDNTPAVIHTRIVDGENVKITVAPKGFGSENMSCLKMFTPAATADDIIDYVVSVAETAGSNPCPPMVLGVGIGGTFEQCALLAKTALCRNVSEKNADEFYASMEEKILEKVNMLDIGPQGFGGKTTALAVAIEARPTHIAGLPVAVNVGCHVTRHKSTVI
ncbi:MAG: fumarate hydratase [Clostridia bacterium]|nr:fumarate hydratase [Clostridia bacterium]